MKIGSVIVSYNPKVDLLNENIDAIISQVDAVLIVDNGSKNIERIRLSISDKNIHILELKKNMGIAYALNSGISYFQDLKFDWVITLDQDSIAPRNLINDLININEFKDENIGIVAADFIDVSQGEESSTRTGVVGYSKRVITSGSLTNIKVWQSVGGFDEQLFIDYVDHDFNQRIMDMGFEIFQVNDVSFKHSLGEGVSSESNVLAKIFAKQSKGHTDHSAFRQYYIFRNGIIFTKRYSKNITYDTIKLVLDIRWLFLFKQPSKKIFAALHGIWDGLTYNARNDLFFQKYLKLKRMKDNVVK